MKKLFNKKMMVVYIVLLCLTLVGGIVSGGFAISYNSKYNKIIEESQPDGLTENIENILGSALESLLSQAMDTTTQQTDPDEDIPSEALAARTRKTQYLIAMSVLFVLTAVFIAMTITSYEYEKYLKSDKYKAKLKRLKKYEKIKESQK